MMQEFIVGSIKILEDEQGYGVSILVGEEWDCIATFEYAMDAVNYFNNLITSIGMEQNERTTKSTNIAD